RRSSTSRRRDPASATSAPAGRAFAFRADHHTADGASMNLKERINEDMKAAMRARDSERLGAIRMLQAAIKQKEVDERIVAGDAAVLAIVEKLIKQRKDSIEQFTKAGRDELVAKESAELVLLTAYLPQQMTDEELAAAV